MIYLETLWHHVQDIMHNSCSQLEIEVAFHALFGDCLCNTLALTTLELAGKQIAQPSFQQRDNASHEEKPDSPAGSPESDTGALPHGSRVESIVDDVL